MFKEQNLKFTDKVEDYTRYRASYPPEVFKTLLSGLGDVGQIQVLDVGAGTGIASRQLADQGLSVTAIEPDVAMVQAAIPHPQVKFYSSPAESIPLPSNTIDLITCFQSFHWFKFRPSLKEFHRLLKPHGRLALVWNWWDGRDPFSRQYNALLNATAKEYKRQNLSESSPPTILKLVNLAQKVPDKIQMKLLEKRGWLPYFSEVKTQYFRFTQTVDLEAIQGLARSYSFIPSDGPLWTSLAEKLDHLMTEAGETPQLHYTTRIITAIPSPKSREGSN